MRDLIDRQAMKNMITNHWSDFSNETNYRTALACVDAVPTVAPEPAQWVQMLINPRMYRCSNCNVAWNKRLVFDLDNHNEMFMKYCPCCGKKMLAEVDYE